MSVGKSIGKQLNYGYPGSFAIQPDQLTVTRVSVDEEIPFGTCLVYDDTVSDGVKVAKATFDMTKFAGVASRIVKQPESYVNQNKVGYLKDEAVTVFQRGIITVECIKGTPGLNKDVWWVYDGTETEGKIGFAAEEVSGKSVKLTNVKFVGDADANGCTAINLLTKQNV